MGFDPSVARLLGHDPTPRPTCPVRGLGKEREESERVGKRKRGDREGWEEKERRVRGLGKEREESERVGKRKRGE